MRGSTRANDAVNHVSPNQLIWFGMLRPCGLSYFGPDVGASTHYHCTAPEFPPPPQTIFHARLLGYHQSACQNAILAATLQSSLRSNGWNVHEVKCYANVKQHVLHDSFRLYYPISICERLDEQAQGSGERTSQQRQDS